MQLLARNRAVEGSSDLSRTLLRTPVGLVVGAIESLDADDGMWHCAQHSIEAA